MKNKFEWEDKYSVGINSIDDQHKTFFDSINEVLEILNYPERPDAKSLLIVTLVKFGNYAFYHLNFEEEYFIKFQYPGAEEHTIEHEIYREKITNYLKDVRNKDMDTQSLAAEIAEFATSWLENHILVMDKKYVQCFKEHNLT